MRIKKWMGLAFLALITGVVLQSCSKDEAVIPQDDLIVSESWTVRPDFATLDTRPQDVITQFKITEKNAVPVKLVYNTAKGAKYALVIGISDYEGTANDLTYCDEDADDWTAQLQAEGYSVTTIKDLQATQSAIENAVSNLASQSIAGNEIAFVYSGHGSRGSIVTSDLYYINSAWFKTIFANATSTKMMFSFDACQIGAMAIDLNATGRVIAVASNEKKYSYDGDATMQNGVFTYYQMEGFDVLNYIYFEDDCQYACDKMEEWADGIRGVRVYPSYVDSYVGNLDI